MPLLGSNREVLESGYKKILRTLLRTLSLISLLAFRNLIRQRRRNILLGFAMTFGLAVLIVVASFSTGISDLFLNKYMVMMSGHVELSITERAGVKGEIIRDVEYYRQFLQQNIDGIKYIRQSVGTWARVIGIGKAEGLNITGVDRSELARERGLYQEAAGSLDDFLAVSDGVALYEKKAKALNVKIGDTLQAKFNTMAGQSQAAKYTVKCILKGDNLFQEMTLLVDMETLKKDLGLAPFETKKLQVILHDANTSTAAADKVHRLIKPQLAAIEAKVEGKSHTAILLCPKNPKTNQAALFEVVRGQYHKEHRDGAIVPLGWAKAHGLSLGQRQRFTYETKYQGLRTLDLEITGFFKSDLLEGDLVLLSRKTHFKNYYDYLPGAPPDVASPRWQSVVAAGDRLEKEWRLLRRSPTTQDIMVKFAELNKHRWEGQALDIRTMQETGSQMLQLEQGLIFLVGPALIVILGIVVIGIINTLRMSIRERGQEIGTMRSIGMPRRQVLGLFIMEYVQLALLAGVAGIFLALAVMKVLAWPTIEADSSMSMFLYDGHLYFLKDYGSIALFWIVMSGG